MLVSYWDPSPILLKALVWSGCSLVAYLYLAY